ncbi:hypothetical protein Tco_1305540 [Tanacetum coccineum]
MERGVRQGDPLSPFHFILAVKGLNALLKEVVNKNIFNGVRVGADGVMCFEVVVGLKINLHKSKLYGVGVETNELERMARFMRCGVGEPESLRDNDKWVGDVAFSDHFVRLYRMESNKEAKVGHKGSWANGEWEWCWEWSRVPRGRTIG